MDRIILHCDLNNFYASVECLFNPDLRDKPVAVTGDPNKRHGIVLAKNELAKKAGVKTGEVIWQAKQKEPNLVCVPTHFNRYTEYSDKVFNIYTEFTSQVEPYGPDECWLDCTASQKLFGTGEEIANTLRKVVRERTGLTISAGVSFNKTFAKMASDMKKPDATTVISKDDFRQKLWHLPVETMLYSGDKTTAILNHFGIKTVGELALANRDLIKLKLGVSGIKLQNTALGIDDEPVREYDKKRRPDSVGHGLTASRDLHCYKDVDMLITYLADKVATRLRKIGLRAYGISLTVRKADLTYKSRQKKINSRVCTAIDIVATCKTLLRDIWHEEYALRTVSVTSFALVPIEEKGQISFFDDGKREKNERLEQAIDAIRKKHGSDKLTIAGFTCSDFIYDKNDAEDFLPFKR